jgi:hypothetical protein
VPPPDHDPACNPNAELSPKFPSNLSAATNPLDTVAAPLVGLDCANTLWQPTAIKIKVLAHLLHALEEKYLPTPNPLSEPGRPDECPVFLKAIKKGPFDKLTYFVLFPPALFGNL